MISVSIIILNYNTTNDIDTLLESIVCNLSSINYEVILVDNNSNDKSYRNLKDKYHFINIVENKNNSGFASGNNLGVRFAKGKYLLFLNPDIVLIDNSVYILYEYMENNPGVGILSGVMLDECHNPIYFYNDFWNIEWEYYQIIGFGYSQKIDKLLKRKEIEENIPFKVDWFHGAYIFMSKNNFEKINGFNETHFMYFEDMELCYNIKNIIKLDNICLPNVKFVHGTRATFKDLKNDDLYFFHINRGKLLFIRNYKYFYRTTIKFISLFGILLRILALPFWSKYEKRKKGKFLQLINILKLHLSRNYLKSSKFKYIK